MVLEGTLDKYFVRHLLFLQLKLILLYHDMNNNACADRPLHEKLKKKPTKRTEPKPQLGAFGPSNDWNTQKLTIQIPAPVTLLVQKY